MVESSGVEEKKHRGMFFELDYGENIKLDLKDKKILSVMGENCRMNFTSVGKSVGLGKDSVRYRLRQLKDKDIYRGNISVLNPFALGFPLYSILIKIKNIVPKKRDEMLSFLESHPFIIWVGETQGTYDFHIDMTAKDITHFDKLLKEIRGKFSDSLKEIKVLHLTKMYGANTLPIDFQKESGVEHVRDKMDASFSLLLRNPYATSRDDVISPSMKEVLVLKELANNANISLQELEERTGIKADTVKNTIKDLIRKNVIMAFRGMINASFLKYHGYILYCKLHPSATDKRKKEFEDYFRDSPKLAFGVESSGSYYDTMHYIFAKNPLEFNDFINDVKNRFSDILEDCDIDLILKDYKFTFFPEGLLGPFKAAIAKIGSKVGM